MRLFRTVWSMESGRQGLEMMDFSMRLFHWEIKSEWQLELPCLQEFWVCSDMLQTNSRMQRYWQLSSIRLRRFRGYFGL